MSWTRRSYDALYQWGNRAARPAVRQALLADGLEEVVRRLDEAPGLGVWWEITQEAAAAVGPGVVEASAWDAERELKMISR